MLRKFQDDMYLGDDRVGEKMAAVLGGRLLPIHHIDDLFWFPIVIEVDLGGGQRCLAMVVARDFFRMFEADTLASVGYLVDWRAREFGARAHIAVIAGSADEDALTTGESRGISVFDRSCSPLNRPGWLKDVCGRATRSRRPTERRNGGEDPHHETRRYAFATPDGKLD